FVDGALAREIIYSSDDGWHQSGKAQPFENPKELKRWMKKRRVAASPDGYEILDAFLGNAAANQLADDDVREAKANTNLYLPRKIVDEATAIGKTHGVSLSAVLCAAWELGK